MSNELTILRPPGAMADVIAPAHVRATIDYLRNLIVDAGQNPTMERLPTAAERQRLNERKKDIHSLLRPASESVGAQSRIASAVGDMLGGWLNIRVGSASEVIAGFTAKLQELPAWAVVLACQDFQEGKATETINGKEHRLSPDFAPSAARVFVVARAKLDELIAEQIIIDRLMTAKLAAPVVSDAERERVKTLLDDHAHRFGEKVISERRADDLRARQEMEAAKKRAADFRRQADEVRLARYETLGILPVYVGGVLCDPEALPQHLQHSVNLDER